MGMLDTIRSRLLNWLMPEEYMNKRLRRKLEVAELHRAYYDGRHRRPLKVKTGQADDNLTLNFVRLVVDRGVAMMLGDGVTFDLPGDDTPEQLYIDDIWDANRQMTTLSKAAQQAALYGYGYIKIIPDGITKAEDSQHRLVVMDSRYMSFETEPEDEEVVTKYINRFNIVRDGEEVARKEEVERELQGLEEAPETVWYIRNYEASRKTGAKWEMTDETLWPFSFPPIVHWAGLPDGESEVADIIELNDRINFIASNINRIIRYHAHPKTWGKGLTTGGTASWGPDEMIMFQGDGSLQNLEMQSDLSSSQQYLMVLRQSLFDISRTVDLTSVADKLGALTNFGLRVLYQDATAKNAIKRELMGAGLEDLNMRLLALGNFSSIDPGVTIWPDTLPSNDLEELQAAQIALGLGIVSKQTVSKNRGLDWEEEAERIAEEQAQADNVGAALIRAFNQGQ